MKQSLAKRAAPVAAGVLSIRSAASAALAVAMAAAAAAAAATATAAGPAALGVAAAVAAVTVAPATARADEKIDLNSATLEQLVSLPGIGKALAESILAYRTENGPFAAVDDLLKVPKIGPATLDKLRPYVFVAAPAAGAGAGAGAGIGALTPGGPVATGGGAGAGAGAALDPGATMSRDTVAAIFDRFAFEPSIAEVHRKVETYASVHPEVLESLAARSKVAGAMPELRFEVVRRIARDEAADFSAGSPDGFGIDTKNDLYTYGWATFHLDRLVFNPAEVPLAGKVATIARARDDLLTLATKVYFERRKLQIDLMLAPPTTVAAAVRSELKLQELTAQLDALTGGWFSRAAAAGKRAK
jgi:competence ComEA-like helix-hairpin-helix protein